MPQVQLRHGGLRCLIVACLFIQVAANSALWEPVESRVDTTRSSGLIAENRGFKRNDESSSTEAAVQEGANWLKGLRKFSNRVFQLATEQQDWPKLEFGWRSISAVILGGIGAALSSAGGLGGGGLFVPLFDLLLEFDAKTSAALSNFMILGGSLANLYINLQQRHPYLHHKPLIDFDVVLLLQPNMLLGISSGVILNVILPDWVITSFLIVTLTYMTIHSFKGGLKRWKKETNQNRLRKSAETRASYVKAPDFHHHSSSESEENSSSDEDDDDTPPVIDTESLIIVRDLDRKEDEVRDLDKKRGEENQKSNSRFLKKRSEKEPLLGKERGKERTPESSSFPVDKALALAFTWFAFFAVQVLRGGKGNKGLLGFESCGFGYWVLTFAQIPLGLSVTTWTIKHLHSSDVHASRHGPELPHGQDDVFSLRPESCTLFAWMALIAGLLGGMLGIGGGMIINPLLLAVGMAPQVTAGTCASMVFFSSSMSVVQFWLMGRVPLDYALYGALICAIFSGVGVTLVHHAIDKYNRASIIVFAVTTVMGVSAILMTGFGGWGVWDEYTSGAYMGFHHPC